ncbi:MAG: alpha/beta fold hydrolase [Myxococcota bacterium]
MKRPLFALMGLMSLVALGCAPGDEGADGAPVEQCESMSIPVTLAEGGSTQYEVDGTLCWSGRLTDRTVQVLSHGAGYGPIYWDFDLQPEVYSYVRAAQAEGYAVFNFARLGVGTSDYPPAEDLTIEADAWILHQVIEHLRADSEARGEPVGSVVTVGHSMGSVITMAHGIEYPQDSDAIVLTGFVHHVNRDYVQSTAADQVPAQDDPRFNDRDVGEGYLSSSREARRAFYVESQADEDVIERDWETRETVSLTEIFGINGYYQDGAQNLQVPVLQVVGDQDFIGCGIALDGEILDCTDTAAVVANEAERFSESVCLETEVVPDAGHVLNLQRQAPDVYRIMLDWANRRVGMGAEQEPSDPCEG